MRSSTIWWTFTPAGEARSYTFAPDIARLDRAPFHPSSSPSSPDFNTLATGASTWPTSGIPGSGGKSHNSSLWKNASLRLKRAVSSPPKLRSERPPSAHCHSSSPTHVAWVRRTDTDQPRTAYRRTATPRLKRRSSANSSFNRMYFGLSRDIVQGAAAKSNAATAFPRSDPSQEKTTTMVSPPLARSAFRIH